MDKVSVLIVDDEPDVSNLMRLRLSKEDPHLALSTVESARECLDYLKDNKVDCILSDYQMPGMNGMELLKRLREDGDGTPFIFITGQGNEEVAREAFKSGANDYFTKDVGFAHFARIINSIEQAVRQRKAEEAKSEELIFRRAIEDSVLSGIVGVDTEGRLNYVNPAFCRMVGWSEEELIGASPPFVYWAPEEIDRINAYFRSTMRGEMQSRSLELKFMRKGGERFDALLLISAIKDSQGRAKGWMGAVYDITERKRIERELLESEAKFKSLAEDALAGVYLIQDGRFVYVNEKASQILGYPKEELLNLKDIYENVHPEDRALVRENLRRRLEGEIRTIDYEFRVIRKDGSIALIEVLGSYTVYKGKPAVIGSVIDITERKRYERELEESRNAYKTLSENLPGIVYRVFLRENHRTHFFNRAAEDITGCTGEELAGGVVCSIESITLPEDRDRLITAVQSAISGNKPYTVEYRIRRKDGSIRHLLEQGTPINGPDGAPLYIDGIIFDITERKMIEEALRESEVKFRKLADEAVVGVWIAQDWRLVYANPCQAEIMGYTMEELLEKETWFDLVFPEDLQRTIEDVNNSLATGKGFHVEMRCIRKDGSVIYIESRSTYTTYNGRPALMGIMIDITERKLAEKALRESEARYRAFIANSSEGIWRYELERPVPVSLPEDEQIELFFRYAYLAECNDAMARMYGFEKAEDVIGMRLSDSFPRSDPRNIEYLRDLVRSGYRLEKEETYEKDAQGNIHCFLNNYIGVVENGCLVRAWGVQRDITDQKRAEEALRESEQLLEAIIDNSTAVIYVKDLRGRFMLVNRRFGELFHVLPESAVGKTDHDLFPAEMADAYRALDRRVLDARMTLEAEEVVPQDNGLHTYISIKSPLLDEEGRPYAVFGISTDITERKRAEEERLSHTRFLENLEVVDRAIRQADDLDKMMVDVLDTALSVFGSDRAWLIYPCDPDASSWRVPMERTSDDYPGAFALNVEFPRMDDSSEAFRAALDTDGPVAYDGRSGRPLPHEIAVRFSIRSQVTLAVYPRRGKPWLFGMHQCSYPRVWTDDDLRLFREIGRRVADGLSSLLFLRDLQESESKLGSTLASMDDVVLVLDNDGILRDCYQPPDKPRICAPNKEFLGKSLREILPPDLFDPLNNAIKAVMETGAVQQVDYSIETPAGTRWFSAKVSMRKDASGGFAGVTVVARDITERRQAEEALEESSAMFKSLAEEALVGIYLVQDGRFVYINPYLSKMAGYTVTEIARMESWLEIVAPEVRPMADAGADKVLSGSESIHHYQGRWLRKDGRVIDVEGAAALTTYNGRPALIGTASDITERKALERQKEDFYAMVTHDLKSPLTTIMGYTELLTARADKFDAESNEMIASVRGSGEKLHRLVEDFLSVSRMEGGKLALKLSPSDISSVLREACSGFEKALQEKSLAFHTGISEGLPRVFMDQKLVQRAVSNLLQNAVNYTPPGGEITLKAERVAGRDGDYVLISVADTGQGIPAEEQGSIFEKYYRSVRTAGIKGTGLGLAIVKAVADAHGGRVELQSEVGKGSTFRLYLPLQVKLEQAA